MSTSSIELAKQSNRRPGGFSVTPLVEMAERALPRMYRTATCDFVQTARRSAHGGALRVEGQSLRYSAIVALGLSRSPGDTQRAILDGSSAADLATSLTPSGTAAQDLGAAALVAWACAEVTDSVPEDLLNRVSAEISTASPLPTVDLAWALTALLAAPRTDDLPAQAHAAAERLLTAQTESGLFPHALPRQTLPRHRAHVGCFADQVYPIQALVRFYLATGDERALDAANRCAERIVALQGDAGQWWWHYDVRSGTVVEGYPVYSVHQHAMAPMALLELASAGGHDHRTAVSAGLSWLDRHPETDDPLLDQASGAIWRKVGRREPRKAARAIRSLSTAVSPRFRIKALDHILPPGVIDYECRPYELGWLLYVWRVGEDNSTGPSRVAHVETSDL